MAAAKTAIFFFFLIIGTSVFPSGSSTGLANAKPWAGAAISMIGLMDTIMGGLKKKESGSSGPSFGSITNQKSNKYHNEKISGTVSFGSATAQNGNQFPQY